MDSKGMVPGVVHDVSNSGETAFMEPIEIIGLANELENLAAEEKAEQIRILRQLCQWIREDLNEIEREYRTLVQLDLRNSIARLAELLGAEAPQINDAPSIRIAKGRHPILMLLQRERGGPDVVPLDLFLGEDSPVMVITGPNAGGKTIAIKTTGLLLLMALSGIPTPAASTSVFPLVTSLLVDIGDEQSIEESLSTFSAHVSRIAGILAEADSRSLVLLDELGTGTEPGQGAAIACAVLNDLRERGALVLATTHLTDIIGFVHRAEGMTNSAMEFDRATLTPLYRLKCGEPGQSHALEIARRYGLPDRVIDFARGMVGRMESEFHLLLAELKEKNRRADDLLRDMEQREKLAHDKELRMEAAIAESRRKEGEILEKGWREAKEIVQGARREVNAILEQARRERSRMAKTEIEVVGKRIDKRLAEFHPEEQLSEERLQPGMTVFVRTIGYDAVISALDRKHGRLRVRAGSIEMEVDISDAASPRGKTTRPTTSARKLEETETPGLELKIIGLRVDEALPEMEKFLNRVSLDGGGEVRIIHGKGTGALMRSVREYLDGHPLVSGYRKGAPFEGGDGATVVTVR
jgi:DNA mismatch repair protein MutS2